MGMSIVASATGKEEIRAMQEVSVETVFGEKYNGQAFGNFGRINRQERILFTRVSDFLSHSFKSAQSQWARDIIRSMNDDTLDRFLKFYRE